ncbi:MAG: hypothetical protein Q9217_001518 [Psora testacea]
MRRLRQIAGEHEPEQQSRRRGQAHHPSLQEYPSCATAAMPAPPQSCEYIATRRAGRPSQASTPIPAKITKPLQHPPRKGAPGSEVHMPSPPASCKTTPSETTLLASPSPIESPSTQQHHTAPCQDTLPNLPASTDPTTPSLSSPTAFSAEFDDFFTSLGSFPGLETPTPTDLLFLPSRVDSDSNTMDTNDTPALLHEVNFSVADNACLGLQILTDPHSLSNDRQSITGEVENDPALSPDMPCCCLIIALDFLKELFPNASKAYTQPCEQQTSLTVAEPPFPTIQSVIAQNKRVVEAMDSILQCTCSQQDGYLLTVLSLVLFKILDWYAVAGRAAPTVTTTTTTAACCDSHNKLHIFPPNLPTNPCCDIQGLSRSSTSQFVACSLCVDGEDSARMAAQMVLSELHRAQRLVNKLSARFKGHGMGDAAGGVEVAAAVPPNSTTDGVDVLCDGKGTWPFSTTTFDQLEADLRRRLRNVSLVIVDMIRRV